MESIDLCMLSLLVGLCSASNILLAPLDAGYNSRVGATLKIGKLLQKQGHTISILISDTLEQENLFQLAVDKVDRDFNVVAFKTPVVEVAEATSTVNQEWVDAFIEKSASDIMLTISCSSMNNVLDLTLKDKTVLERLSRLKLDLIILDEYVISARVIAAYFNIPTILYLNWGPLQTFGNHLPQHPAYVPTAVEAYSDIMTFTERLMNLYENIKLDLLRRQCFRGFKEICMRYNMGIACENIENLSETLSLILMNRNDALHPARPFMPHTVSVEGFFLEPPKSLSTFYSNIIQQASDKGIIIASFGTLFRNLSPKRAAMFAEAFGAMPQIVIWSYAGPAPDNLAPNTHISEWIPQNDLLAHHSVKLFVTHCGIAASFQAINYALPVVGVPFFFDQMGNCQKLCYHAGMGEAMKLSELTAEKLTKAMKTVIENPQYKRNAEKSAAIYHSQPMDPADKVVYWVEYVLRHKGAYHLRSQGEMKLNFFQYYLLDILLLFTCSLIVLMAMIYYLCRCSIRCFKTSDNKQKAE